MAEKLLRRASITGKGKKAAEDFFRDAGAVNYRVCYQSNYFRVIKRILNYFCNRDAIVAGSRPKEFIDDTELPHVIVEGYEYIPVIDNKECVAVVYHIIEKGVINHVLAFIRIGGRWYNADNEYGYLRLLENPDSPPNIKKFNKYLGPNKSNYEYDYVRIEDYYMFYIEPEKMTSLGRRRQHGNYSGKPCFGQSGYTCGPDSIQSVLMLADGFFEIFNQGIFNNTVFKILEKLPAGEISKLASGAQASETFEAGVIKEAVFKNKSAKDMDNIKDFISTMFLRYYLLLARSRTIYNRMTNSISQTYSPRHMPRFSKSEHHITFLCLVSHGGTKYIARAVINDDDKGLIEIFNITNPYHKWEKTLAGHTNWVWSVTDMGDGRLASASYDKTVRVWDVSSGVCLRVLEGHTNLVWSVTALGDGRLASASSDKTVRVWDASSGVCLRVLEGHTDWVRSVTALGDGRLASASEDKTVRVWDASSGVCLRVLEGHADRVWSVTALGDGRLASASSDNTVRVWDASSGVCLRVLDEHTSEVLSVTSLGDGRLASASADKTVRVWNAKSGECLHVLKGHTDMVWSVTSLGDGRLASASEDNTVRVWDLASQGGGGKPRRTLKKYRNSSKFSRKLRTWR